MSPQHSHTKISVGSQSTPLRTRRPSFWERTGTTRVLPLDATDADYIALLKARCTITEAGCWEYAGAQRPLRGVKSHAKGYTSFSLRRVRMQTHRASYILLVGPIPAGIEVLHRCDNPPCCNPDHLFLGTGSDNAYDRVNKKRDRNSRKSTCPKGHPYDYVWVPGNRRRCSTCDRERGNTESYKAWRREYQRNRRARLRAMRHKTDEEQTHG